MSRYIPVSRVEGDASRQAHCDLPEGTYEREISKEGFFGPASFLYHRHPPTGWTGFEGPLRPHGFDLEKLRPLHDILLETIVHASHYQGRAFAVFQMLAGEKPPRL